VDASALDEVLGRLAAIGLRSLVSQPPTLEELFMRHYQVGEAADDQVRRNPVEAER
jgi:ABC-2 type transport system ATP-binding protein